MAVPDYLSLAEARLLPEVDLPSLLAVAKRRPDKLPLFLLPPAGGWLATFVSRVMTSEPRERELWSYSSTEVWVKDPFRVSPELLRGATGELLMQRFRLDGRNPDRGTYVREYYEFAEPRRFCTTDLHIRPRDVERWKLLRAAAASSEKQVDRLRATLLVAIEQGRFTLSTKEACALLGVSGNTLYKWRREAEAAREPVVWHVINPKAKRKQYRWLADREALRDWSTLLDLIRGGALAPEAATRTSKRSTRRAPTMRKGAVARELDELLG